MATYSTELTPFVENRVAGGGKGADRILPAMHEAGVKYSQAEFRGYGDTHLTPLGNNNVIGMIEMPINTVIIDLYWGLANATAGGTLAPDVVAYNISNPDNGFIVLASMTALGVNDQHRVKSLVSGGFISSNTFKSLAVKPWSGVGTTGNPFFTDAPDPGGYDSIKTGKDLSSLLTASNGTKLEKWGLGVVPRTNSWGYTNTTDEPAQRTTYSSGAWNEAVIDPWVMTLGVLYTQ